MGVSAGRGRAGGQTGGQEGRRGPRDDGLLSSATPYAVRIGVLGPLELSLRGPPVVCSGGRRGRRRGSGSQGGWLFVVGEGEREREVWAMDGWMDGAGLERHEMTGVVVFPVSGEETRGDSENNKKVKKMVFVVWPGIEVAQCRQV